MLNNFKIKQILAVVASVVLGILVVTTVVNDSNISTIKEESNKQSEEILPNLFDFLELQLSVLQVQQWLTDVSATRAEAGFDDGYSEAGKHFMNANLIVDRLIKTHKELGEEKMVAELEGFKRDLQEYYNIAVEMANVYIKEGTSEGNKLMKKLDPFAQKLSIALEKFISQHKEEYKEAAGEINHNITDFKTESLILAIILMIIVATGFFIINIIIGSIKKIDVYLGKLSELGGQFDENTRLHGF